MKGNPMQHIRQSIRGHLLVLAAVLALLLGAIRAAPASAQESSIPTLVAIRAAHHAGFDRVVFDFSGPLPQRRDVRYVPQLIADGSGQPVPIAGNAILKTVFEPARAHTDQGEVTVPNRITFPLPNVMQVVRSGDFESVLSHGIGLARQTNFRVFTLTNPSRVVIDIDTPFSTVLVRDYFWQEPDFMSVKPVLRPVIPPATARGALERLFAGPTLDEIADGLIFVSSEATGFTNLSIKDEIARVQLTGGCNSRGSTITIASEIFPTLKQFPSVRYVKIYDPSGHTETPNGRSDSIPVCLEP
jgi:hypothetical protein